MNKDLILENKADTETIAYLYVNGKKQQLVIKRSIPVNQFYNLINIYCNRYFNPDKNGINIHLSDRDNIGAEMQLRVALYDWFTNITVFDDNGELVLEEMYLLDCELYNFVTNHIENWNLFLEILNKSVASVENKLALDKSVGSVIRTFSEKIVEVLERFEDVDTEKLKTDVMEIVEKMKPEPEKRKKRDVPK